MTTVSNAPLSAEPSIRELYATYTDAPGLWGFVTTVDHKRIAARYVVTTIALLFLAGMLALDMRIQLMRPDMGRMSAQMYDEAFALHGSTMLFLFAVPVMEAMAMWLVPLMLGQRNVAFPRLGAFSYWLYLGGVLTLWISHALDITPDLGWFEYPPLSGPAYSPGHRADIWAQMITFTEVAALCASVNIVATIFKMRPPGMTLARIPFFVWAMTDRVADDDRRAAGRDAGHEHADRATGSSRRSSSRPPAAATRCCSSTCSGSSGIPRSTSSSCPAVGFVSAIVETFSRRPLFGHVPMVLSMFAIAALAFGLWVHHMFAVGLPRLGNAFYTAASMAIALPAGIQIFCWIATIWSGRPRFATPMLWVVGFIATFVIGGLSGVMTASAPLDLQLTDTYFIVAHLHYVLVGGAVFPLFGAFCYWYPKATGRMMSERLGKWALRADRRRLQRRLLPDALPRARRHAAPRVHVRPGDGLGTAEPRRHDRRRRSPSRAAWCSSTTPCGASGAACGRARTRGAARRSSGRRRRRRRSTTSIARRSSTA